MALCRAGLNGLLRRIVAEVRIIEERVIPVYGTGTITGTEPVRAMVRLVGQAEPAQQRLLQAARPAAAAQPGPVMPSGNDTMSAKGTSAAP